MLADPLGSAGEGAVAVVTGATRGIGRHTARLLALAGCKVVVTGRSTEQRPHRRLGGTVESVVDELKHLGAQAVGVAVDLGRTGASATVITAALEEFGRCDVLISNAAYMWSAPLLESPPHRFLTAYQVNVVAFVELVQGLVPGMLERGYGRVIAVSSGSASLGGRPNFSVYGCSKAALERLTDAMHTELGGQGVSFNTLRIDETVPTEMYQLSEQLGSVADPLTAAAMYTPEQVGAALVWMARQPREWSGWCVGFDDLRRAGVLPPH